MTSDGDGDVDVEQIREALSRTTPGPWTLVGSYRGRTGNAYLREIVAPTGAVLKVGESCKDIRGSASDVDLVLNAPSYIRALLARIDALEGR